MSYTPTEWNNGDVITAEKLNKLENGVAAGGSGGGVLVVNMNSATGTLDKTWQEIFDAKIAVIIIEEEDAFSSAFVTGAFDNVVYYAVTAISSMGEEFAYIQFKTDSPDGYPVIDIDDGGGE